MLECSVETYRAYIGEIPGNRVRGPYCSIKRLPFDTHHARRRVDTAPQIVGLAWLSELWRWEDLKRTAWGQRQVITIPLSHKESNTRVQASTYIDT